MLAWQLQSTVQSVQAEIFQQLFDYVLDETMAPRGYISMTLVILSGFLCSATVRLTFLNIKAIGWLSININTPQDVVITLTSLFVLCFH